MPNQPEEPQSRKSSLFPGPEEPAVCTMVKQIHDTGFSPYCPKPSSSTENGRPCWVSSSPPKQTNNLGPGPSHEEREWTLF